MSLLRLKRLLLAVTAMCWLGAIALLAVSFLLPVKRTAEPESLASTVTDVNSDEAEAPSLIQQFLPHWKKPLRRPLVDPPPEEKKPKQPIAATKATVLPNVELVGTIVDGDRVWAMLQIGQGQFEVCKEGSVVMIGAINVEVLQVASDAVQLRHQSHEVRLPLKRPARIDFNPPQEK